MSKQDEQQLEKLIADVFFQAKRKSITPKTVRLESIIKRGKYDENNHEDVESSAIFWHMCDLIWLLLYPILYLLS